MIVICVCVSVVVGRGAYQQHADSEGFWQRAVRDQSVHAEGRRGLQPGQEGSCGPSWLLWSGEPFRFHLLYKAEFHNPASDGLHDQEPVFPDILSVHKSLKKETRENKTGILMKDYDGRIKQRTTAVVCVLASDGPQR